MKNKRYYVNMRTNKLVFEIRCKSLKMAKWLMNLKIWKYSKIHDMENEHKCIAFVRKED